MHAGCFGEILKEGFTLYTVISLHWSHLLFLVAILEKVEVHGGLRREEVKPKDDSDVKQHLAIL